MKRQEFSAFLGSKEQKYGLIIENIRHTTQQI
jgi:hypothetical protein